MNDINFIWFQGECNPDWKIKTDFLLQKSNKSWKPCR